MRSNRLVQKSWTPDFLSRHEMEAFGQLLAYEYVLDVDSIVKLIFGRQEGAELGYNPRKPGRPSHSYHAFFVGRARITLGVDVLPGRRHADTCGMARLWSFLDALPGSSWPFLLRGDVGYGNDGVMSEAEVRGLRYLFKIRRTGLAKELFAFLADSNGWKDCGWGWEAHEHHVRLGTWRLARRLVFVRRPVARRRPAMPAGRKALPFPAGAKAEKTPRQQAFEFAKDKHGREWDCCILVTDDTTMDATALSQPTGTAATASPRTSTTSTRRCSTRPCATARPSPAACRSSGSMTTPSSATSPTRR